MEGAQKQGELIEKTDEEKKIVRQAPKAFKKYIRQLEIEAEEKEKIEKESQRKSLISKITNK